MSMNQFLIFSGIGVAAGLAAGFFGIGGGIIIVPALVLFAGFSQATATGTSLAILMIPVGLMAVLEYHRHGHVDIRAALIIAVFLFVSAWAASIFAHRLPAHLLKPMFGVFLTCVGIYIVVTSVK
jgi:uncharacterized membrane protein YfcA